MPVVKDFIKKVRERAIGHEVIDTLNPAQQIIKIVDEELTAVLGSETSEIIKSPKIPTIIMMAGLQGLVKRPSQVSWLINSSRKKMPVHS